MNIEEFKKSNVEIDTELSNLLKAELFTVEVRPVYKEKYKSLLNRALHIADPELVEHLARKLFEVILNDFIAKKFHKAYNEVAIPAFNMQYNAFLALRDANSNIGSQLHKIKQERKRGAKTLHAETNEMKALILDHYAQHKADFDSKEGAAFYYRTQYPLKFSTIRNYLKNK